ncbi:hypothetical protein N7510_010506 [Penicillium lagena]|uniref:uncharacterized protein n=1 Tax=Penicillium lagena TaxID=94218 RepID=UPI0025414174|nr:uncharacterized protein N7510_010506 [Penicillium lagena]KAJ5605352.1 hypothetical protein N7510_010506 [Penicillium lagena]
MWNTIDDENFSASKIALYNTMAMLLQLQRNKEGIVLEQKLHRVKRNLEISFINLQSLVRQSAQADVMRYMPNSV